MSEYKPIPVEAARFIAREFDKQIVIVLAWTDNTLHTTTYGSDPQHKEWAARGGEVAAKALGALTDQSVVYEDYRLMCAWKLLQALKDARDRFHKCALRAGSDKEFVDTACSDWDKKIAEAEIFLKATADAGVKEDHPR